MSSKQNPVSSATCSTDQNSSDNMPVANQSPSKKGFRFWAIIATLSIAGNLTALEATIVSTALPTIITELNGADKYLWVANAYLLAMQVRRPHIWHYWTDKLQLGLPYSPYTVSSPMYSEDGTPC